MHSTLPSKIKVASLQQIEKQVALHLLLSCAGSFHIVIPPPIMSFKTFMKNIKEFLYKHPEVFPNSFVFNVLYVVKGSRRVHGPLRGNSAGKAEWTGTTSTQAVMV